jgi:hypothetical protein
VVVSQWNGDVLVVDESAVTHRPAVDVFEPKEVLPGHREYVFVRQIVGPAGPSASFQSIAGLAVDPQTGEMYVASTSASSGVVYEFSATGEYEGHIEGPGEGSFHELTGVGVVAGRVFVAEADPELEHEGVIDVFGPDVIVPDVETTGAVTTVDREGHISARLEGTVNPDSAGEASCSFAWGLSEAFGQTVGCASKVPDGASAVGVSGTVGGLAPDTGYWFRLQASNANGSNLGEPWQDRHFVTPGPGIASSYTFDVSSGSLTFGGQVDPNHAVTSVYFQYTTGGSTSGCGTGSSVCSIAPVGSGGEPLGSGSGDVMVREHVQSLMPGTVYHYRLVAVSELEVEPHVTAPVAFFGADQTVRTARAGVSGAGMLDGREWELVSPANKHGGVIYTPGKSPASMVASAGGERVSFALTRPTEAGVEGFSEAVQVLSDRSVPGEWSSKDISLPHAKPVGSTFGVGLEYRAFSSDLCTTVVEPQGPFTNLVGEVFPPASERTPYLRHNCTCTNEPSTCYEPLLTHAPGYADVPEGTEYGAETGVRIPSVGAAHFRGASKDLQHVILTSTVQLTPTPTPKGVEEVYEWSAQKPPTERLQLVSLNETNEPSPTSAGLGYEQQGGFEIARGAVSVDGGRVFWQQRSGGLFMRDTATGVSLRLDQVQGGSGSGPVEPVFQGASPDGSRVFFTDTQQLTGNSGAKPGQPDLYVCEISEHEGTFACGLTDLTPKGEHGEAGYTQRVMTGYSEDGSWAYYLANAVLPGTEKEGAKPGNCINAESPAGATCNLYVAHNNGTTWQPAHLVAVLSGDDYPDWSGYVADPAGLTAGVSPDGRWLAFVSDRSLSGYDNQDAISGKPDQEVYTYHANENGPGTLTCVSCTPTGARPEGTEYKQLAPGLIGGDESIFRSKQWVAATLPGYEQYSLSEALYQPHFMFDTGRVFFNATSGLVPGDTNNNPDIYEWEPQQTGTCNTTTETYDPTTEGCLALISSGRAANESAFIDANQNGDDAFFMTAEKLLPTDTDTAQDIYDAHACQPDNCPSTTQTPPPCTTTDACRPAPTPQPTIYNTPPSATYNATTNTTPTPPTTPTPKPPTKPTPAQQLAKALKTCRHKHNPHTRHTCETQAHKKYKPTTNPTHTKNRRLREPRL